MHEKPLPVMDPESKPYWDALRGQRLILKFCRTCLRFHFYPREFCPHCHSDDVIWRDASGLGEIYSFTIARRPAGPAFEIHVPYVIAIVALAEGPKMLANILTDDPAKIRIGQPVGIEFVFVTKEVVLPAFRTRPAGENCDGL